VSQQNGFLNDAVLKALKLAGLEKVEHINPTRMMSLSKTFLAICEMVQ